MATECSYCFKPAEGKPLTGFPTPNGVGEQETNNAGHIIGYNRWEAPVEELMAIKASGRLEWEEFCYTGFGYIDFEDGEIVKTLTLNTPSTYEEAEALLEKHPELLEGIETLLGSSLLN